jgi:hypothetical protein
VLFHQLGPVADTVAIPRRILRETHRAALRRCGLGTFTRVRGAGQGAFSARFRTPVVRRFPGRASPSPSKPSRRNQRDGEHHQSSDGPGHLGIVQDRHRRGPQKRQRRRESPGSMATRAFAVLRYRLRAQSFLTASVSAGTVSKRSATRK